MLTKTTMTAIRTLVHVGLRLDGEPLSVRHIAEDLGESPTYLAKVSRHLVKAGILRAHRGVMGGIELNRPPKAITLLVIVEACQGTILADFCRETSALDGACAFHLAAAELHGAIVEVLSRWTLDQFVRRPGPSQARTHLSCLLYPRPATRAATARERTTRSAWVAPGASGRGRSRRIKR